MCRKVTSTKTTIAFRPDSIDLLFLGSFPDPFERVERDKNKIKKGKRGKNLHENTIILEKKSIF